MKQIIITGFIFLLNVNYCFCNEDKLVIDRFNKIIISSKSDNQQKIEAYTEIARVFLRKGDYELSLNNLLYAKRLNPNGKRVLAPYYNEFSDLFSAIGAYNLALEYQKKYLSLQSSNLEKYYSYSVIGELFLKLNDPDSAFFYYKKQFEIACQMNDYVAVSSALNNKGLAYMSQYKLKSALEFLNYSRTYFKNNFLKKSSLNEKEKLTFLSSINENIGRCYFLQKNYTAAIKKLESCDWIQNPKVNGNSRALILSYLSLQKNESAKNLLLKINKNINQNQLNDIKLFNEMNFDVAIYTQNQYEIKKYRIKQEKILEKENLLKKYFNNRMNKILSIYLINEAKMNIEREVELKKIISKKLAFEKKQKSFLTFIILIIIVNALVFGVIIIQFYKNRQRKTALENQHLNLINSQNNCSIKNLKSNLTEYVVGFKDNLENERYIINKLSDFCNESPYEIKEKLNSLIVEWRQRNIIEHQNQELESKSTVILNNFNILLLQDFPNLTNSEVELCFFIYLGLSNKEIAFKRNVTTESIKQFKNRLRIKLGKESQKEMIEYFKNLNS